MTYLEYKSKALAGLFFDERCLFEVAVVANPYGWWFEIGQRHLVKECFLKALVPRGVLLPRHISDSTKHATSVWIVHNPGSHIHGALIPKSCSQIITIKEFPGLIGVIKNPLIPGTINYTLKGKSPQGRKTFGLFFDYCVFPPEELQFTLTFTDGMRLGYLSRFKILSGEIVVGNNITPMGMAMDATGFPLFVCAGNRVVNVWCPQKVDAKGASKEAVEFANCWRDALQEKVLCN